MTCRLEPSCRHPATRRSGCYVRAPAPATSPVFTVGALFEVKDEPDGLHEIVT